MIFLKVILLQVYWYLVVLYSSHVASFYFLLAGFILVLLNFFLYRPHIKLKNYLFLTVVFTIAGMLFDYGLMGLHLIDNNNYHSSFLSLWTIFICYYGDVFNRFEKMNVYILSLLGGAGGLLSYYSASRLNAISIIHGSETLFLIVVFLGWAFLFPLSLRVYRKRSAQ